MDKQKVLAIIMALSIASLNPVISTVVIPGVIPEEKLGKFEENDEEQKDNVKTKKRPHV